jgi:hypothetical protein
MMNIFYIEKDPYAAARSLADKHVVKMIVESAQMLCTAVWETMGDRPPYKPTHRNHPCSIWARESADNYKWLLNHAYGLLCEYTYRYKKVHRTTDVIVWCDRNKPWAFEKTGFTEPPQAMPDMYKIEGNSLEAYRNYYAIEKVIIKNMAYDHTKKPDWLIKKLSQFVNY